MSTLNQIIRDLKENKKMNYDESINIDIKTGINSTKQDENMRGTLILKHGITSPTKILVFAEGDQAIFAKEAGAARVGFLDLIEDIKSNGVGHYDVCLTTPDMLMKIKDIASILGRNGLMPNKKDGTISDDLASSIKILKSGTKLLYKNDKSGYIRMRIAKSSFTEESISDNIHSVIDQLHNQEPAKVKQLIKRVNINSTQGKSIEISLKMLSK